MKCAARIDEAGRACSGITAAGDRLREGRVVPAAEVVRVRVDHEAAPDDARRALELHEVVHHGALASSGRERFGLHMRSRLMPRHPCSGALLGTFAKLRYI